MEFPDLPRPIRIALPAQPLLLESVSPSSAVSAVTGDFPDLAIAQRYQASVEAQLANGNFKVVVSGHELQMSLPEGARTGDQLNLLLVAKDPRLKFALLSSIPAPGGGAHAIPVSLSTPVTEADLSKAGRFLGTLNQDTIKSWSNPPLIGNVPILSAPPISSQQLPGLLQQALSYSGLFYENHQAQWIAGRRTLDRVLQEPQGKIPTTPSSGSTGSPTPVAMSPSTDTPVHPLSLALVQQQINLLETGHLTWRGDIWPGQSMDWDIMRDPPPSPNEENESTRYQTRLSLNLPRLGEVIVNIALENGDIRVNIHAKDESTLSLLRSDRQPLSDSMQAAGLNVIGLEVGTSGTSV